MDTISLTGWMQSAGFIDNTRAALLAAAGTGWIINTYADPTADARENCGWEYAAEVAAEDPSLVYVTRTVQQ
jgi:hypothetical protein